VVGAVNNYTSQLLNNKNQGESLMFLVHILGDMHQPLHAAKSTDRGGNNIPVILEKEWESENRSTNLHKVCTQHLLTPLGLGF
jgi:hypothetical protein